LAQPLRVEAGIYTLDVRMPGYFPVTRSVALAGGEVVKESIQLSPSTAGGAASGGEGLETSAAPTTPWLTWTFAGLTVGAGAATATAWALREHYARVYNDNDQCLRPGQTREQACGNERSNGELAET
jgi:hypothetical protein